MLGQVSAPTPAAASSLIEEGMFTFRWKIPNRKQQIAELIGSGFRVQGLRLKMLISEILFAIV
jgi:hypothetical protein